MDTVSLYYEERGSGTPVVLLHGFPLDHTIWNPVVPLLEIHARLILPDLRGHGKSPLGQANSIREMAEDVAVLLDMLDIPRAILVGHSMGGYVALAFARAHPHRLAGLGLVASQAESDTPEKQRGRYNTAADVRKHGLRKLAEGISQKLSAQPGLMETIRQIILQANPAGVVSALIAMAERPDATDWLGEIRVPAVVIAGEADALMPPDRAVTLEQLLPHSWRVSLPGVGHLPMMEAPEQTAHPLVELIQSEQNHQAM